MHDPKPHTRLGPAALIAIGVFCVALTCGCNYFRPSRPELPEGGNPIVPRYTQPETTLVTLGIAIEDKAANNGQSAYIGGFARASTDGQGYTATFDPLTLARFDNAPTDWDIDREEIFYANLSRQNPGAAFSFLWGDFHGAPDDNEESDPRIYYRSYLLQATPDGATFLPVAKGNAELHMTQIGGNWKIVRWVDWEDPEADRNIGEECFGQLRLEGP